jgi:CheY-like chemotaxis protein
MRFPIDVVFLDAYMRVIKIVETLPAWRSVAARHSRAVLELAAGEAARRGVKLGDRLDIQEVREPRLARTLNGTHRTSERSAEPHVLVISRDRRFRAVAAALFSRRGWPVAVGHPADDLETLVARACPDVALVDASPSLTAAAEMVARVKQARRTVQTVIVSDGAQSDLPTLSTHPKWGSFDSLCTAVAEAHWHARGPEPAVLAGEDR